MYEIGQLVRIATTPETEHIHIAEKLGIITRSDENESHVLDEDGISWGIVNIWLKPLSKNSPIRFPTDVAPMSEILNYHSHSWEEEIVVKVTDDTDFTKDTLTVQVTPSELVCIQLNPGDKQSAAVQIDAAHLYEILQKVPTKASCINEAAEMHYTQIGYQFLECRGDIELLKLLVKELAQAAEMDDATRKQNYGTKTIGIFKKKCDELLKGITPPEFDQETPLQLKTMPFEEDLLRAFGVTNEEIQDALSAEKRGSHGP